jgi:hypothetical protein
MEELIVFKYFCEYSIFFIKMILMNMFYILYRLSHSSHSSTQKCYTGLFITRIMYLH